jgi:hypothetical protein
VTTKKPSIKDTFKGFASALNGFKGHVLALDPGETTGWAHFYDMRHICSGQIQTGTTPLAFRNVTELFQERIKAGREGGFYMTGDGSPHAEILPVVRDAEQNSLHVVIEDYKVYSWKSDSHSWSGVHTVKVIAACELAALLLHLPYRLRMAQHAKGFCTDGDMEKWGLWVKSQRHARDAIRHATLYIIEYRQKDKMKGADRPASWDPSAAS